jgi:hypothetical protein
MMLHGSREFRYFCANVYLSIWEIDATLFNDVQNLQTLELLGSFIPIPSNGCHLDTYLLVGFVSWIAESLDDYQLLVDSNILKDLLRLPEREIVEFFSKILRESIPDRSISDEDDEFLEYLVGIGALSYLVEALRDMRWNDGYDEEDLVELTTQIKDTIRAVMRSDERYKEMVLQMEMPESLKDEFIRGLTGKRKRSAE